MKKRILFVCKHNLFRSKTALGFFKQMNDNKKYTADSAGLIRWKRKDIAPDGDFAIEQKVAKKFKIYLTRKSKSVDSSILKKTDILVIAADDVPADIFKKEKSFSGKIIKWNLKDVKPHYKENQKEKIAETTIIQIMKNIEKLVKNLK